MLPGQKHQESPRSIKGDSWLGRPLAHWGGHWPTGEGSYDCRSWVCQQGRHGTFLSLTVYFPFCLHWMWDRPPPANGGMREWNERQQRTQGKLPYAVPLLGFGVGGFLGLQFLTHDMCRSQGLKPVHNVNDVSRITFPACWEVKGGPGLVGHQETWASHSTPQD